MTELYQHLVRRIAADGPISIAHYMQECLLHPVHGYYTTRDPFGASGDFITAPEISQMFGELIGLSIAQSWIDQGAPTPFVLAEIGPGRGVLMADILRATAKVPGFHASLHLHLVEASPALKAVQKDKLRGYNPNWHDHVGTLPELPFFLVANEFFDALPIRQFIRKGPGWSEKQIGVENNKLVFGLTETVQNSALAHRMMDTLEGDIVETCPLASAIIEFIGTRINSHGGIAIIVDYGDWQSRGDTFQAVSNHTFSDPLENPGHDDLTAHVDFGALVRGLVCAHTQMVSQAAYLGRLGISERAKALAMSLNGDALKTHIDAFHRLTDADKMGTLFKVIGLYPKGAIPPAGFSE